MEWFNWVEQVLRNYAQFNGRSRRKEYWYFMLFYYCVVFAFSLLSVLTFGWILLQLFLMAMLIPSLAVTVRRLHDVGKSGWFYLFILIPLAVVLVVLAFPARRAVGRTRREKRFRQEDTNRAVIAAYLHLKKLEKWGGQTSEELFELAKKARFSPHTLTEAERQTAVEAAHTASARVDRALPWYKRFCCRYILGLC